jgi:UDP-2,3-diacylglucosamine hydrolase
LDAGKGFRQDGAMVEQEAPLGLIAGSRRLPFVFAAEARRQGRCVAAVAFDGETDPALASEVDTVTWVKVGQLGRMIEALKERGVRDCVMLGQIAPSNLFNLRPDLKAMALLLRLKEKNAHTIFGAIGDELAKEGIRLVDPLGWLGAWMPGAGYAMGSRLDARELSDVAYGARIAREIARLEIGQSVVVKDGTTLAVEGFEGTDACLERGGKLAGKSGGAVAVKLAKSGHDVRFDLPCVGPRTLEVCARSGVRVLAFEPGRTILLDRPEAEALAVKSGISLVAIGEPA